MKKESIDVDKLPFSKLFTDYLAQNDTLSQYFETSPFDENSIKQHAENFDFGSDRTKVVDLLTDFHKNFDTPKSAFDQIKKLQKENTLAVVTGQQLTLYGGPLFTIYKTLTAIIFAKRWSALLDRPVIPVFWLADEDHDIEEVIKLTFPQNSSTSSIEYKHSYNSSEVPPVSNVKFDAEFEQFKNEVGDVLDRTDFFDDLWNRLHSAYKTGETFRSAFGSWLLHIFKGEGLILAGSNVKHIKQFSRGLLSKAVKNSEQIYSALENTTHNLIDDLYHGQVQVHPSNLFFIDDSGARQKIQSEGQNWQTQDRSWSTDELKEQIEESPERFSPNVFLRPILQDHLLPTIGYVAGPGETAYYAQMKEMYHTFDRKLPVIIPRFSITLVESAIDRILEKLPFEVQTYNDRIEDLEKRFVDQTEEIDIEKFFGIWKQQMEDLTSAKKDEIKEIDPSLAGSAGKAKAVYFSELDKLKGKVYRSVKQQENVQLNRISKIKNNLFPNGNLQEREIAFIYFMNKYGNDIWIELMALMEDDIPDNHKLIYL